MRKIDQLVALLKSQDPEAVKSLDWLQIEPEIKPVPKDVCVPGLEVELRNLNVGFMFDETGEKFFGIYNWKD